MLNQTGYKIDFKYLDLENCFKNFYIVPDYQREYVWEERQVTQLLSDVYEEYGASKQKEYFIGSVVVFKRNDSVYEVIDGQQRLTTLFLLICGYKKIYNKLNEKINVLEKMIK